MLWLQGLGTCLLDKGIPRSLRAVAALSVVFAFVFVWIALLLIEEFVTGTGQIGEQGLGGLAASGLVEFSVFLIALAVYLVIAGRRLLMRGKSKMLTVPLVLLAVYGVIGESISLAGSGVNRSNDIGMIVLLVLALPVVLLVLPSSRRWLRKDGGNGFGSLP